ncbi:MAG TPA: hypothetical protein VGK94_09160 [Candidatus Polarisedimenticolia bacterium]|jgi:hypothetical protein
MKGYRLAAAIALVVLALVTGASEAGPSVVTRDGHLLTVEVESDPYSPTTQGLVVFDQSTAGTTTVTIPSTWDPVIDQGPQMTLNPYDGEPVVVWSRQQGGDFELAMMRRMPGGDWAPFNILTGNTTNDIEPRSIVDLSEMAHIVWWPSGAGGPVFLQGFDVHNGGNNGPPQRPFEPPKRKLSSSSSGDSIGGAEDPGTIGGSKASASPCLANPSAAPDHGVVLGCGRPAAYQLSNCILVVGVYDTTTSTWTQTWTDLSSAPLDGTSIREIVQTQVDARCY